MIDTICLLIPLKKLACPLSFLNLNHPFQKQIISPPKYANDKEMYFPKITIYPCRFFPEPVVKIEFSAPKLIYGNNVEELRNEDFAIVLSELQDRLHRSGIAISITSLAESRVSSVHFSKNIVLADGYTSSYLISELGKVNFVKSFDIARVRYINDGLSLCAHTASHELIIYDKVADLNRPKSRAIDRGQSGGQENLFKLLTSQKKKMEILRFEVRLCKRKKLNSVFIKLGHNKSPSLREVFNSNISRDVLIYYWKTVIRAAESGVFTLEKSPKDLIRNLSRLNPGIGSKKLIYLLGLAIAAKSGNGMRELRELVAHHSHDRSWQRIASDHRTLITNVLNEPVRTWVGHIDDAFREYKPLRLLCPQDECKRK